MEWTNEWTKQSCENEKVHTSCDVDYTSMVERGSLNGVVVVQLLNHWHLLSTYYVLSALTLQNNLLKINRNILSTRHPGWPYFGPWGWQIILRHSSPNAEERPVMYFTPQTGLSGGLIYLLSTQLHHQRSIRSYISLALGMLEWSMGSEYSRNPAPSPSQFLQTPCNRLPYSASNLQYNEFVLFWFILGTAAPGCLPVVLFTPWPFSFL